MILATFLEELGGLTWLILGLCGFILVLVFRKEIKGLIQRVTGVEWKGAKVTAEPGVEEEGSRRGATGASAEPEEKEKEISEAEPPGADSKDDEQDEDVDSVRRKMFNAYFRGDRKEGDSLFARLQQLTSDPIEIKRDGARRMFGEFIGGINTGALEELKGLIEDPEIGPFAERLVGICLEHAGRKRDAAEVFARSASRESEASSRASARASRAKLLTELGEGELAEEELRASLRSEEGRAARQELLSGLAECYESSGNKILLAITLNKLAEETGNDSRKWFKAGYAYSNTNVDAFMALTAHCYRMALRFDADSTWAVNNFGALASRAHLEIPAIEYYRRAIVLNNSLAAANLAEAYLNAGFADEAQGVIDEALKDEDPHEKVATIAASIRSLQSEQREKLSGMERRGSKSASFLTEYLAALTKERPADALSGEWSLANGTPVELRLSTDARLTVEWNRTKRFLRKFEGSLLGASAKGKFHTQESGIFADSDPKWSRDGEGFLILGESKIEMARLDDDESEYLTLNNRASS